MTRSFSIGDGDEWDLSFEALDVAIPAPAVTCVYQPDGTIVCHKADPNDLQRKANRFRKGYKNWRQHKPKGARGEVTEIAHKAEAGDESEEALSGMHRQSSVSLANMLHQVVEARASAKDFTVVAAAAAAASTEAAAPGPARRRGMSVSALPTGLKHAATVTALPGTTMDAHGHLRTRSMSPTGSSLHRGFKSATQLAEGQEAVEENWLKFYVNPFANLLDVEKVVEPVVLKQENLHLIQENFRAGMSGKVPGYCRDAAGTYRMCHVGVGGFHRSHQAVFTDDLLEAHKDQPDAKRWHICGIGLMPWDRKMYDALTSQDCLYTVLFRSQQGNDARVVGSIMDFVFAPDDYNRLIDTLSHPDTKIVSLTITERGYCQSVDGHLDQNEPNIAHDLQDLSEPKSAIGMIVAALSERRRRGVPSFTVLSCDNMPENGDTLKHLVLEFAELGVGPDLADWIKQHTTFPNTMVDRITPVTETQHKEILSQDFGVMDEWPVVAEHFGQWIIEDHFVNGERPRWDEVGVMFVPDVKPYECMKLRLLNGSHSALSYVSYLAGFQFVDDAMNNKQIGDFVYSYMDEVCFSVPRMPGVDLEEYKRSLFQRFSNPYVKDKVERLMLDGSKKLYNTMKDAILYLVQHDKPTTFLGLAVAAYIRYVTGMDEAGNDIDVAKVLDPLAKELREPARRACGFLRPSIPENDHATEHSMPYDPREVLRIVFGKEMADVRPFVDNVSRALKYICRKDVMYALLHFE